MFVKSQRLKVKGFSRGVSLLEVVVGTAILLLAVTGLLTAYNVFVRVGASTLGNIKAAYLLEEGLEAMSVIRDYGWTNNIANLAVGTNYYLSWNGTRWVTAATASKIDDVYSRYIVLENVNRDGNDNIAESGSVDPGTKKLTIYVSWPNGATTSLRFISSYLTNLFSN
ncbi:MAG: hypothetical protein HYV67_00945 [Candidatus Taylorbacteria bacterium]|nr:hypothetical protein [Candidatus Taylorbacteria bacterium]